MHVPVCDYMSTWRYSLIGLSFPSTRCLSSMTGLLNQVRLGGHAGACLIHKDKALAPDDSFPPKKVLCLVFKEGLPVSYDNRVH